MATIRFRQAAYAVLGLVLLGVGVVGLVVPGLPTTEFVFGAAWCFARCRPAWERRLLAHPLAAGVRRFRDSGGMSRQAKVWALASMWTSVAISSAVLARGHAWAAAATLAAAGSGTAVLVLKVRTLAVPAGAAGVQPLPALRNTRA